MRIPMEDWLRGCVYHDGRHGEVTLSTDKVLEIANYIQLTRTSLADGMIELPPYDRKTSNSSEKPNKSDIPTSSTVSKMEQVEDEPQTDCNGCKFVGTYDTEFPCANCSRKTKDYYAKGEPQTVRSNLEPFRVDEPQTEIHGLTDCDFCKGKNCEDCEGGKDEPQTERKER